MSRRGHYPGGHSIWYSDTARAQSYGETRSKPKATRGDSDLHQPARPYQGSEAVVHEWLARNGKKAAKQPKPQGPRARRRERK